TNADEANYDLSGHIKYRSVRTDYPSDSLFQDFIDDPAWDNNANLRLNGTAQKGAWSGRADYQLFTLHGDSIKLYQQHPGLGLLPGGVPDDRFRVMDLTHIINESDGSVTGHRLDRFYFDHITEQTVVRVGRQAISWGNGLFYNPMDIFNPFDPAAIDKEYKVGDDMVYGQYLLESGNDWQAVWVGRRDLQGDVTSDVTSTAAKYHAFVGEFEVDALLAQHYDAPTAAIGGVANAGGGIVRGDIVATNAETDNFLSGVLNYAYSWVGFDKNMSGVVEYYYNGFGISNGDYSPSNLANNPELLKRLARGEIFTLGQDYLAAGVTIEMSPLWLFNPTLFNNLNDHSGLLQLTSLHDIKQDMQLILALNLPYGKTGTEFGGIDSGVPGRPWNVGASAFLQLAWYF
ncbi:MAG: hypothetical protein DRQ59_05635, partial [Gammaproteobacteria bacterium]